MDDKDGRTTMAMGRIDTLDKVSRFGTASFVLGTVLALGLFFEGCALIWTGRSAIAGLFLLAIVVPLPFLVGSMGGLLGYLLRGASCPRCTTKIAVGARVSMCCPSCGVALRCEDERLLPASDSHDEATV